MVLIDVNKTGCSADSGTTRRDRRNLVLRRRAVMVRGYGGAMLSGLRAKGVTVSTEVADQGWGLPAAIEMPDGSELPIYQPKHPSPPR